jgi:pimeloyl-ACP methyl ester carboxylesterase
LFVPHVSTVPANAGETVRIAVRHLTPKLHEAARGVVLFTTPGATSAVATLDLDYETYSLSAAVAAQGFDVYVMDHTGVGRSPHPTMDDPCNADPEQQRLLIPNPLRQACPPTYPHHLVTIFTEVAEIASVVDYVRKQTRREKVSFAGWSRALSRFGLYAAEHPEKVEKLAIVGPGYRRDAPSDFPPASARPSTQSPRTFVPHFSFFLRTADEILRPWQSQRQCEDTVDPGMYDALMKSIRLHADPGAATWGTPPGAYYRVPAGSQVDAGWNRTSARRVTAPVLLVVGEDDPRFAEEAPNLYTDIGIAREDPAEAGVCNPLRALREESQDGSPGVCGIFDEGNSQRSARRHNCRSERQQRAGPAALTSE